MAAVVLLSSIVLISLVSCGNTDDPELKNGQPEEFQLNNPFVVVIPQVGEIFDVASVLPAEISAVSYNIYDWMFDRDYGGTPRPGYAESWQMSEDKQQLTVTLRQDVTFHNGASMTAADVAFSWERIVDGGYSSRITRALQDIEIVGDYTLRFHFNKPELAFVAVGGIPVLSKARFEEVGAQHFRQQPIGTGPYVFKHLQRGQYLDLERNENYWGRKPEIARVRFAFVTEDTTRVAKLQTGEADMAMMLPFPLVPQVEADPHLTTVTLSPGGMTVFLALKTDNPQTAWADKRVREAIALAIDREAIVEHILLGYPDHFPFLAPTDLGFDSDLGAYPYDPDRSRELIEAAGIAGLELKLPYVAGGATGVKETAEAVALYLTEVGIKTNTSPMEGPQFIPWVLKASGNPEEDYIAVFIGGIAGRAESSNPIVAQLGDGSPFAWYVNPEINALVREMARMPDDEERAEAIRAIGRAVHADYRYIPMWTSSHIYGMKKCLDFTPTLGEYDLLLLRDVSTASCRQSGD